MNAIRRSTFAGVAVAAILIVALALFTSSGATPVAAGEPPFAPPALPAPPAPACDPAIGKLDEAGGACLPYAEKISSGVSPQATGGNIVDIKTNVNLTDESFQNINKVDITQIRLTDALLMGDEKAKYKVIVFDDPD